MEKQVEKVFVKVNQVWQKGEIINKNDETLMIRTQRHPEISMNVNSPYVEPIQSKNQKFAYLEVKERLAAAYIGLKNLPADMQEKILDTLVRGEEYFHDATYVHEKKLRESVKAVQMRYSSQTGSKLDVQIKRKEPVTLTDAKAFNHQFTREEFESMINDGQHVLFQGSTGDGELFSKLAYYEPKLNDIRTKPVLSDNTYFYGQKLTKQQALDMNKGQAVEITIDTHTGKRSYMVTYSPRAETFITRSLEKQKAKNLETKDALVVGGGKKKNRRKVSELSK